MYDLTALRNWLIYELYQYTDETPVVPQNSPNPRPPKPYYTYNFISPYVRQPAFPALVMNDVSIDGEDWIRYDRWELPTITVSFNTYASDLMTAYDKALHLREYFAMYGYMGLKSEGVIVARMEAVEDRTLLLDETDYEYRAGFDIILRVVSETSRLIETIEEVHYAMNEAEGEIKAEEEDVYFLQAAFPGGE